MTVYPRCQASRITHVTVRCDKCGWQMTVYVNARDDRSAESEARSASGIRSTARGDMCGGCA